MNENDYLKIVTPDETFRGYALALDAHLEAGGTFAIPFIAFAKMSGANVDKVFVKEDFENHMEQTAAEYNGTVRSAETPGGIYVTDVQIYQPDPQTVKENLEEKFEFQYRHGE